MRRKERTPCLEYVTHASARGVVKQSDKPGQVRKEERRRESREIENQRQRRAHACQCGAAGHAWRTCFSEEGLTIVAGGLRVQIHRKRP